MCSPLLLLREVSVEMAGGVYVVGGQALKDTLLKRNLVRMMHPNPLRWKRSLDQVHDGAEKLGLVRVVSQSCVGLGGGRQWLGDHRSALIMTLPHFLLLWDSVFRFAGL